MASINRLSLLKNLSVSCPQLNKCLSSITAQVKPHVPLIRFRKTQVQRLEPETVSNTGNVVKSVLPSIGITARGTGIDEALLPRKYHRQPLSQLEMEIIEQGGAF